MGRQKAHTRGKRATQMRKECADKWVIPNSVKLLQSTVKGPCICPISIRPKEWWASHTLMHAHHRDRGKKITRQWLGIEFGRSNTTLIIPFATS